MVLSSYVLPTHNTHVISHTVFFCDTHTHIISLDFLITQYNGVSVHLLNAYTCRLWFCPSHIRPNIWSVSWTWTARASALWLSLHRFISGMMIGRIVYYCCLIILHLTTTIIYKRVPWPCCLKWRLICALCAVYEGIQLINRYRSNCEQAMCIRLTLL